MHELLLHNHLGHRIVRISYFGMTTSLFFVLAIISALIVDFFMGDFDRAKAARKSTLRLSLELVVHMWIVGIIIYEMRALVDMIPFFDGKYGFERQGLASVTAGGVFVVMFIGFQKHLTEKIQYLYLERLTKK